MTTQAAATLVVAVRILDPMLELRSALDNPVHALNEVGDGDMMATAAFLPTPPIHRQANLPMAPSCVRPSVPNSSCLRHRAPRTEEIGLARPPSRFATGRDRLRP